jgi:methionyl-tRNA formyltransferase
MRVLFLGMPGRLATAALQAILAAPVQVVGVAVPAPPGASPVAPAPPVQTPRNAIDLGAPTAPGLLAVAGLHGLHALALRSMSAPAVQRALAALEPDLLCVACWPWRIPASLLALPSLGWLNLHPAPLPELRGPAPLFWTFQQGRAQSAVTAHWMDAAFDTGPIAATTPFDLPLGIDLAEAEARAGDASARLLHTLLPRLLAGERPATPQPAGGSYAPLPAADAFRLDPAWPAERAFRFMRGTADWQQPYTIALAGRSLRLIEALDVSPQQRRAAAYQAEGGIAWVQFTPGVLCATLERVDDAHPSR